MTTIDTRNNIQYDQSVPHIIKYMGSKRQILDFVVEGINECYLGKAVCDLFAGSAVLSGALRDSVPMISNDIQAYSSALANTYLSDINWSEYVRVLDDIINAANTRANLFFVAFPDFKFDYSDEITLQEFQQLEAAQQDLIDFDFSNFDYHLFTKYYSGTYWSYEQCVWIDAIRSVADDYKETPIYYVILASLMFAMSYNSQSTGHYAQYRDATNEKSMLDIKIYRQKEILPFFIRKFEELQQVIGNNPQPHQVVCMDYLDCLDQLPKNTTIYADPPYAFVHYSRFYHAIETLVRYDYPDVRFKGRYRTDRHQSPFCIRTQVEKAFEDMFVKVREKESNLVLSYSNTGMIELEELIELAKSTFGKSYAIEVRYQNYLHSTMGRREDKSRDVQETLLLAKKQAKGA